MAVRRMAFIKMYHAFDSWRELVAAKREAAMHYHRLDESAWAHMQVMTGRSMLLPSYLANYKWPLLWHGEAPGCVI